MKHGTDAQVSGRIAAEPARPKLALSLPFSRALDRYIARELLAPLLFGLAAFTSLFMSGDLLNLARMAVELGAPLGAVFRVFTLKAPQVLVWTFPMAMLLATLLSLSRLSTNSEMVAMQAGGVSVIRILTPVFVVGASVSVLGFAIGEWVVPVTNLKAHQILVRDVQGGQLPRVSHNVILKQHDSNGLRWLLYAREFDGELRRLSDVTMIDMVGGRPERTTFAKKVVWQQEAWQMEDVTTYLYGQDDQVVVLRSNSGLQPVAIGQTPEQIAHVQKNPEQMSYAELRQHIAILQAQGQEVHGLLVQLHLKVSIPLASLVFALVAAPLGFQSHRSASSLGFGLSIIVIFVYYVIMSISSALGQGGYLPPLLAGWLQNLLLGAYGLWRLLRIAR